MSEPDKDKIISDLNIIVGVQEEELSAARRRIFDLGAEVEALSKPIPMRIACPDCRELHIDEGEFETKPHHTHSCQFCGLTWRPAIVATVGVRFLPGFKNEETS